MSFEKNIFIGFEKNNIESIRNALEKYTYLLNTDEAVKNQVFDIEFVKVIEGEKIALNRSDIEMNHHIFQEINQLCMDDNGDLSETLFFMHALAYDSLKEQIIETVQAISAYSRRHNDTWELWYDDMSVFGLDPLYAVARVYPEYSYLLGAYIIPYWDTEHADYAFSYLTSLFKYNGFNDHILKTLCYLDNTEARLALMTTIIEDEGPSYSWAKEYFDLYEYFIHNSNEYDKFKQMMKERFKNQTYLQYSRYDFVEKPILEFYKTILDTHGEWMAYYDPEENDDTSLYFVNDTIKNEAIDLQNEIEKAHNMSLAPKLDEEEDDDDFPYASESWVEFFKEGFDNGKDIWDYIIGKKDEKILEDIKPIDFLKYTKEKGLAIYQNFDYYLSPYETYEDILPTIFDFFVSEYANEKEGQFDIFINGEEITNREMIFRAIDVLYRLNNNKVMPSSLIENLLPYELLDIDRLIDRIDRAVDPIKGLIQLSSNEASQDNDRCKIDTLRIDKMICNSREIVLKILKNGWHDHYKVNDFYYCTYLEQPSIAELYLANQLSIEKMPLNYLLLILFNDARRGIRDDLSEYIIGYFEKCWKGLYYDIFRTHNDHIKAHKILLDVYLEHKSVTLDEVYERFESELAFEEVENGQKHYYILSSRASKYIEGTLPMLFIGSTYVTTASSHEMRKALCLLLKLAPVKTLKTISNILIYKNIDTSHNIKGYGIDRYDFIKEMKRLGVTSTDILAWELTVHEEDRIRSLCMDYIDDEEINPKAMIQYENKATIEKALEKVSEVSKEQFYDALEKTASEMI